jgi:hypothetical protein
MDEGTDEQTAKRREKEDQEGSLPHGRVENIEKEILYEADQEKEGNRSQTGESADDDGQKEEEHLRPDAEPLHHPEDPLPRDIHDCEDRCVEGRERIPWRETGIRRGES